MVAGRVEYRLASVIEYGNIPGSKAAFFPLLKVEA